MKYTAPPGGDPNAPYVDGNRSAGTKGSIVPAAAVEHPQRELDHLIGFAGLTPSGDDLEQVRKAIEALIAAATGGGETSQFLLVSQARARLPIFPEVESADGRINVMSPAAGSVQVPSGVNFMHRGIFPVSTSDYDEVDRTFATAANKTYHLRWNPTDGFSLKDLADAGYNPGVLPETDASFDADYDDALFARVVTNGSNVATITNLANIDRLMREETVEGVVLPHTLTWAALANTAKTLNWARTPKIATPKLTWIRSAQELGVSLDRWNEGARHGTLQDLGIRLSTPATRYGTANLEYRYQDDAKNSGLCSVAFAFVA